VGFIRSARIVQIHPTRRCNLRCLHCYSDSSPEATDELPPELVTRVLGEAAMLGYRVASVSGGEPFMYQPLPRLLTAAKASGMRTQLVSNGLAITPSRL
jgi:MoaA/NifB/PqqE/SkfB family radical SAM enzyme